MPVDRRSRRAWWRGSPRRRGTRHPARQGLRRGRRQADAAPRAGRRARASRIISTAPGLRARPRRAASSSSARRGSTAPRSSASSADLTACTSCRTTRDRSTTSPSAVDLGQTPGDIVFLSFTDSDLAAGGRVGAGRSLPSLRLAPLAAAPSDVRRPLCRQRLPPCQGDPGAPPRRARLWRYGAEELAALARARASRSPYSRRRPPRCAAGRALDRARPR